MMYFFERSFLWFVILLFMSVSSIAQTIKGKVTDDKNNPVIGATIQILKTQFYDVTDVNGNYGIKLDSAGTFTLKVTSIGQQPKEVSFTILASEERVLDISMTTDSKLLDEVVVVGYGVQRKREVTGNVESIETERLLAVPAPSFEAGLHGLASGVQVTQGSGLAGSSSVIRIRGIASISAGGDPLYVIDGIPITQDNFIASNRSGMNANPLASINPQDIESVEVLKDAAATAIYGSRGSNGVILITTKRGGKKGLSFNYSTRFGAGWAVAKPNMLDNEEYLQLYQEAWENDGNVGLAPLPSGISWEDARNTNTNWVDETIGTGLKNMHSISANYGTKFMNIYGNLTADQNESYLIGNSYNRYSARLNHDYKITKKIQLQLSHSYSQGINNRVDAAWSGGLGSAMSTALPIYPIYWQEDQYDADSNLVHKKGDYWNNGTNPVRDRELKNLIGVDKRTLNNASIIFTPTENWVLRASGNYEYFTQDDYVYETQEFLQSDHIGYAKWWPTTVNNYNANATANYLKTFKETNDL
ncbi:MAG: SusC/RagA family TonB-linked outer membrane protein, partial [Bacteroidetes bacterium]|nr:SusC/RagA family TonB-linked outer membrane protein [Bacteroidota bacterium]